MTDVLIDIASMCDGLRVDMAMLLINRIHAQCWGNVLKETGWDMPESEFWTDAIKAVREKHPDTILMAEVYWGLDEELMKQGFDATYDKAIYDIAISKHLDNLRGYIGSKSEEFLAHSTHFVENHDEPRAVAEFGGKMPANCAAGMLFTLPGIRLQFHGQWSGKSKMLDVHLRRCEDEERDEKNEAFYRKLNNILAEDIFHKGSWRMTNIFDAGRGDRQAWRMSGWTWSHEGDNQLFVANYSDEEAGGHIILEGMTSEGKVDLKEQFADTSYERDAAELKSEGLFVWLKPWQMQLFKFT